ncbi:MAG: permease, partial [Spirochaetes bacterium]
MKIGLNVILLYAFTLAALLFSAYKDRKKTKKAVLKGLKSLNNILPQFITVLVIVSIVLSLFDEALMTRILGEDSGFLSTIGAAVVGSITLIPGFIAFPVASELLRSGAGIVPVATFISTLMMVGIVTLPMEIEYLGKRAA